MRVRVPSLLVGRLYCGGTVAVLGGLVAVVPVHCAADRMRLSCMLVCSVVPWSVEVTEEERKAAESSGILLPKLLRRKRSGADAHGSSPVGARAADANSDAGSSTASPTAAGCGQSPKGRGSGKRHSASEDIVTGIFYLLRTLDAEGLGVIEKEARRLRRVREETARRR